jgi:type II secretory pathway pseudopilin PulG
MPQLMPTPHRRRGATLAELIVVLVLFGIVGTALVKTMTRQQQYYADQNKLLDARRELRLGANFMPSDLRGVSSSGGDIISIAENQIVLNAPVGTSIVCARTANRVYLPPTNLAKNTLTAWYSQPVVGDTLYVYDENLLKGSEDDTWDKFAVTDIDVSTLCSPSVYMDAVLDPPATKKRYAVTLSGNLADSVKVGAVVRFTRPVRYRLEQLGASGQWYLTLAEYRNGAWGSSEQIAGPYRPFIAGDAQPSGLQFRYYDTLGTRLATTALTKNVGRIDVYLRAERGAAKMTGRGGALLKDSVLMRIGVRNSK